ncbi:glycosyltransferase family 4 protein [Ornithinimicrobium sp. W1679]|uniref:glycosyltransferase family 4 protein n=1 Tax=Ornithinimicrobium sp. W1679 TaxID=3418770 RepID=UPI003CEC2CC5
MLLVAHFSADDHMSNDRFTDLATRFQSSGMEVELVTSSFSHVRKQQRTWEYGPLAFKRTLIAEPGYRTNVSFTRLLSHRVMANKLSNFLQRRARPDLIYCAVPSLAVGQVVARYARRHQIPLVIDIQDLWPEAFQLALPTQGASVLFAPMSRLADYIYRNADMVVAVSASYAARAAPRPGVPAHVLYLGTDLATFDAWADPRRDPRLSEEVRVAYVGTLGRSYDLNLVSDAISIAQSRTRKTIRLIVMGDGPRLQKFKAHAAGVGIRADFVGRLPYREMVALLTSCDMAVNPIVPGAAASVINKVADYGAASLPVLNTQDHPEYRALLHQYEAGINCRPGDASDLADSIVLLAEDLAECRRLGTGNRRLAEERFDRGATYPRTVDAVHHLLAQA